MTRTTEQVSVVAFVGFPRAMGVRAKHLLRHCGFIVTELARRPEELRALQARIRVDAIVVDARSMTGSDAPDQALVDVLSAGARTPGDGDGPAPIIVLGNRRLSTWVRSVGLRCGAHFVSARNTGLNYKALTRTLRDSCGLESDCCAPAARSKSPGARLHER